MFSRRDTQRTLGERDILGDEAVAELLSTIEQLRAEVGELRDRVDSQFTTIAAHAEIARQQAEFARGEARADLDRSRETLIGLIEQVRAERSELQPDGLPGPSAPATDERLDAMEERVEQLSRTLDRCFARQNELADTMTAFLDTMLAEQRGEPVAGLSML